MTAYFADYAWLGGDRVDAAVLIEVDGERIAAVRAGAEPSPEATRLAGVTLPGLANAHSHAFHRALRGRTHRSGGRFWTWREDMYAVAARLTPDSYHALARATYAEMALAGITCVGEFHYVHHDPGGVPYADANAFGEALIAAAADAGIRITLLDACYLAGGIGQALRGAAAALRRRRRRGVGRAGLRPARHAPRARGRGDPLGARRARGAARDRWSPGRASAGRRCTSTCPSSAPRTRRAWPRTGAPRPAAARGHGALGPRSCAVHATHLSRATSRCSAARPRRSACARRPSATSPTGSAPPGRWPTPARRWRWAATATRSSTRSRRRAPWSSTSGLPPSAAGTGAPPICCAPPPPTGTPRWAGPRPAASRPARSPTSRRSGSTPCAWPGAAPATLLESLVFAAAAADVREVVVGGRRVVAEGRHALVDDVPRALDSAIAAVLA